LAQKHIHHIEFLHLNNATLENPKPVPSVLTPKFEAWSKLIFKISRFWHGNLEPVMFAKQGKNTYYIKYKHGKNSSDHMKIIEIEG
jgi:hypothetical protein